MKQQALALALTDSQVHREDAAHADLGDAANARERTCGASGAPAHAPRLTVLNGGYTSAPEIHTVVAPSLVEQIEEIADYLSELQQQKNTITAQISWLKSILKHLMSAAGKSSVKTALTEISYKAQTQFACAACHIDVRLCECTQPIYVDRIPLEPYLSVKRRTHKEPVGQ